MTFVDGWDSAVPPAASVSRVTISDTVLHIAASNQATSRVSRRFQQDMGRASQERHNKKKPGIRGDSGTVLLWVSMGFDGF